MKNLLILLPGVLILGLITFVLIPNQKETQTSEPSAPIQKISGPKSLQELQTFWDTHMKDHVEAVFSEKYKIPEINNRHASLVRDITARHGKMYSITRPIAFCKESEKILAAARIVKGQPDVAFVLPALLRCREELISRHGPEKGAEIFEISSVVGFLHELDHLANGTACEFVERPSFDEIARAEAKTWGQTCEWTMRPLVEVHKLALSDRRMEFYKGWVLSGRDAESPSWQKFIRQKYLIVK